MSLKKIWLTGSRGFIGNAVVSSLNKSEAELFCFTNKSSKEEKAHSQAVRVLCMDYLDAQDIKAKVNSYGLPDIFIHLGWGDMTKPDSSLHLGENVQAGKNLIGTLFKLGLKKFIFVGSMNEYGARIGMLSEDMAPQGRLTNYAKGKIEVAKFGFEYAKKLDRVFIHVRPFYVYGAGQRQGSLINQLYQSYCKDTSIDLSPCEHYRDYIHVSAVAEGIRRVCDAEESVTVNLGSGMAVKVKDFVLLFWKLLGGDMKKLNFGARSLGSNEPEQPRSYADLSRLKNLTNWASILSLEEGIKITIKELENSSSNMVKRQ
ncbi:MAG: NAD(P)-dependent oxidoreductase [Candidatus Omnitrophica bacterium]|nr:NAD(P)-dependent oxidoreductase [Candidatus Omnitrophota bacterium]